MNFQLTHPWMMLLAIPALAWVFWLGWKTDVQINVWRRWAALTLRSLTVTAIILALAGLQWLKPLEGTNIFFLLDRSDSVPSPQQEGARRYVNQVAAGKKSEDQSGLLVFGSEAALETAADPKPDLKNTKILAVVGSDRTDIAGAIRLGSAAFPEHGQKRLVLISDGNENIGDAIAAISAARQLGITLDAVPLGVHRGNDVAVLKLSTPNRVKRSQTFEAKIFIHADLAQPATVRLYRNDEPLGEQKVDLAAGKNLFTFPQNLSEPGFYAYTVVVDAPGDNIPQNNRGSSFTTVRGDPRILVISASPKEDAELVAALRSSKLDIKVVGGKSVPTTLAEMQSYDAIFLSNMNAGDVGSDGMRLLESAVRDFGVGLVCVGGPDTYAAGGYRGTPLETTLPVNMELDSKKVLPPGAVALVMHGMEFMNGNQVARDCAVGVLDALGPTDEMGVVLWDGNENWLFPMTKIGPKGGATHVNLGNKIMGMNQGDLPAFQGVMNLAYQGLKSSSANLKHMIVFSDGDPVAPSQALMQSIVDDKITVSTVLIAGHAQRDTMEWIAAQGNGRFFPIDDPRELPQIFLKETAVILKSAIYEGPFDPKLVSSTEPVRGLGEFPQLRGYVCTTPKSRAEVPIVSDKGDPILAHWQFGLGRAVAFTSDAKAKWGRQWINWSQFRQFWTQIAQWSLRRVENMDLTSEVSIDKGEGHITVEALDDKGDFRNFLSLQTILVSPKGERRTVRLEQTGPGHYQADFPTREIGSYSINLMEMKDGLTHGSQFIGASVDYSPEFNDPDPNLNLLKRLTETGGGKLLDPANSTDNPFLRDRKKTHQPRDLWEWLLGCSIIMFTADVGIRRILLGREEFEKAWAFVRNHILFWKGRPRHSEADESLTVLLERRDQVRSRTTGSTTVVEPKADLFQPKTPVTLPQPSETSAAPTIIPEKAPTPAAGKEEKPTTTTDRLLEAKRRAKRKQE